MFRYAFVFQTDSIDRMLQDEEHNISFGFHRFIDVINDRLKNIETRLENFGPDIEDELEELKRRIYQLENKVSC